MHSIYNNMHSRYNNMCIHIMSVMVAPDIPV